MPHVSDSAINEMLAQLPKDARKTLANIVAGKVVYQVRCLGACDGDVVAYLYGDGFDDHRRPQYRVQAVIRDGKMKLRSSRKRLDGQLGFQCHCGNDSLIARHEAGAIKRDGLPPSREGIATIYSRLQKDPADYPEIDGAKEVDGFRIERVRE